MASSSRRNSFRQVNVVQFIAIIVAIIMIGSLIGALAAGLLLPVVGAAGATIKAIPATFKELPSELEVISPSEESRMLDSEGRVIARFYSERRIIVNSDQIAPIMKNAIISIEDRRFLTHHGIDPEGMARAVVNNLTSGDTQGASTITQQYVKNMLMEQGLQAGDQDLIDEAVEMSAERKLREARYAIALESQMSKDEILTNYLNLATFGTNIYGVEAAARAYFSTSANELTISQAALLAGTVQSPVRYDPLVNPEASQERRDTVLAAMREEGVITAVEYGEARAIPVEEMLNPEKRVSGCAGAGTAAYLCTYALQEYLRDDSFGADRSERERLLNTGGLTLRTTVDQKRQAEAYQAVVDRVPVGDPSGLNTAIVSVVPQTGHIVAMAQNTPYGIATEANPSATEVSFNAGPAYGGGSGFPSGSTFKTFTLVQWFANGRSAYEQVGGKGRDFPNGSFKCGGQPIQTDPWYAGDLAGKEGSFNVIQATDKSVNQAFGDMATQVDFCKIFETAAAMGATDAEGNAIATYPGNLIGATASTPLAMTNSYATLANNGVNCKPMALTEVEARDGKILKSYPPECTPVIDEKVAQQVTNVLYKSLANSPYQIGRPYAGKSGTTDNNSNAWTIGYTPQLATAAWAGFASNSALPGQNLTVNGQFIPALYGGLFVGPMFVQYMQAALDGTEVIGFPDVFIGNVPPPPPPPAPANPDPGGPNPAPGPDTPDAPPAEANTP